jgi:hypothetical protein
MVVAQQRYHVFRVRNFGEAGEPAEIAVKRCDFPAVTFKLLLHPGRDDKISYLGRKESSQPAHALDFTHLISDASLELLV